MSLEAIEGALARLYTDDGLRERFFAAPEAVGPELGLDAEGARQLGAADRSRIDLFAESLRAKRLGEVRGLLAGLREAIGEEAFRDRFLAFARGFVPEGVHKHHADAIAFAREAGRALEGEACDAARFDLARIGLFFRLDGGAAVPRPGPAAALVRRGGRRVLLLRARGSSRLRAVRLF